MYFIQSFCSLSYDRLLYLVMRRKIGHAIFNVFPSKRIDISFGKNLGVSFSLVVNIYLFSLILVLTLQCQIYCMRITYSTNKIPYIIIIIIIIIIYVFRTITTINYDDFLIQY
jgi:hypothetical protein